MMIVPMIFRTIRIAEALSASAEVRGIDLSGRKQSYIRLRIKWSDLVFILLLIGFVIGGIFIN